MKKDAKTDNTFHGLAEEDVLRYEETARYEEKIRRLEDNVSSLRLSRRILMSLLEQVQSSERAEIARLTQENNRLRRRLGQSSRQLWQYNTKRFTEEETGKNRESAQVE